MSMDKTTADKIASIIKKARLLCEAVGSSHEDQPDAALNARADLLAEIYFFEAIVSKLSKPQSDDLEILIECPNCKSTMPFNHPIDLESTGAKVDNLTIAEAARIYAAKPQGEGEHGAGSYWAEKLWKYTRHKSECEHPFAVVDGKCKCGLYQIQTEYFKAKADFITTEAARVPPEARGESSLCNKCGKSGYSSEKYCVSAENGVICGGGFEATVDYPNIIYLDHLTRRWFTEGERDEYGVIDDRYQPYKIHGTTQVPPSKPAEPLHEEKPPARIYLQNEGDGYDPVTWEGATWCHDRMWETDVEYIRSDLSKGLLEAAKAVVDWYDDYVTGDKLPEPWEIKAMREAIKKG